MIHYSQQAYEDGYDFSSLTLPEQIATQTLYTNKEDMWKKGRLRRCANYYFDNAHWDASAAAFFESDWYFKNSGDYHAIILGCSKSKKAGSNDYIISLLIDEHQIRYIKFTPDYDSEVTETIFRELNYNLENTPQFFCSYISTQETFYVVGFLIIIVNCLLKDKFFKTKWLLTILCASCFLVGINTNLFCLIKVGPICDIRFIINQSIFVYSFVVTVIMAFAPSKSILKDEIK